MCVLGANEVSAVEAIYDELSAWFSVLRIEGEFVVEPWDTTSFNGTVLILSETYDSESLDTSVLLCDLRPLAFSGKYFVVGNCVCCW